MNFDLLGHKVRSNLVFGIRVGGDEFYSPLTKLLSGGFGYKLG